MKLGIVGFSSYFRRSCVPYLLQHPEFEIRAVCDLLETEKLSTLTESVGIPSTYSAFERIEDMLASVDVEAVIISTPHCYHGMQVQACLQANKHVLVDKPLSCDYNEARKLVDLAESKSLRLMVANQRRYESVYKRVKKTLDQEHIGVIHLIHYLFANSPWYDYRHHWRGDASLNCGGVLMDIGILACDMVTWLTGSTVHWVEAIACEPQNHRVDQSVLLLSELNSGTKLSLTVTYEAPFPSVQEELSLYGENGSLFVRRFRPQRNVEPPMLIEQYDCGEINQLSFTQAPDNSKPLDNFLQSLTSSVDVLSDGRSSLPAVQMVNLAYRSIQENRKVMVESIPT